MPITLTATAGDPAANSYATLSQAAALAVTRVGGNAAAWVAGVDDEAKKRALITATREIDSIPSTEVNFYDERNTNTQALEFPRTGETVYPQRLVQATIELAVYFFSNSTLDVLNPVPNDTKHVQSGEDSVEWFDRKADDFAFSLDRFPPIVQRLLGPLLVWLTVSQWGSGIAVRAS